MKNLLNMAAGKRLVFSTSLAAGLSLVLGITACVAERYLGQQLDHSINRIAKQQQLAGKFAASMSELDALERGIAIAVLLQQTSSVQGLSQKFIQQETATMRVIEELQAIVDPSVRAEVDAMHRDFGVIPGMHNRLSRNIAEQKVDVALQQLNQELLPVLTQLGERGRRFADQNAQQLVQVQQSADIAVSVTFWLLLAVGALSAAMAVYAQITARQMRSVMRSTVDELNQNARLVAANAGQVSASSQSVSHAASEQAASLEETSASSEQIHSMTRRNAENAAQATRKAQESAETIAEANAALEQMVNSMNEITSSSNKISKIIKVIDDIAFQTNILALNAAVEAARAGEAGMGFAVVADEVRNLAQRSAQAARDTTQLIEESIHRASEGKAKLDEVAKSIAILTDSSLEAKRLVEEVHAGSQEQARGIAQISRAVLQMEQLTQQLAATAEQSAAAGQDLSAQAHTVDEVVTSLRQLVGYDADLNHRAAPVGATRAKSRSPQQKSYTLSNRDSMTALANNVGLSGGSSPSPASSKATFQRPTPMHDHGFSSPQEDSSLDDSFKPIS